MTQIFSASRGGGPLIFYDLAKALAERGHELYVVCNLSTEIIEIERVKLFVVKPFLKDTYELPPSPTANLRYIANSLMTGAKIVKQNQIQLIHTNSYTPVFAGSILSKLKNIPMIALLFMMSLQVPISPTGQNGLSTTKCLVIILQLEDSMNKCLLSCHTT